MIDKFSQTLHHLSKRYRDFKLFAPTRCRSGRSFLWVLCFAAVFHLVLLWSLRNLPLYHTRPAQPKPEPVSNFFAEFVPAAKSAQPVSQPAEERFTVSTNVVENAPTAPAKIAQGTATMNSPVPPVKVIPPMVSPLSSPPTNVAKVGLNRPGQISLFNLNVASDRVVYLIDYSGSMWRKLDTRTRYEVACDEVRKSIRSLAPQTQFNIVVFADHSVTFQPQMISADEAGKKRAEEFLNNVPNQEGSTDLLSGLQAAISLQPDSVFLLTDGIANMPEWQVFDRVKELQKNVGMPVRLYAVGMVDFSEDDGGRFLKKLTRTNGGSYVPYLSWSAHVN